MDYASVLKFTELLVLEKFVPCTVLIYVHVLLSRSIDASEALQVPGVVDVVTAKDVSGENGKDEQACECLDLLLQLFTKKGK